MKCIRTMRTLGVVLLLALLLAGVTTTAVPPYARAERTSAYRAGNEDADLLSPAFAGGSGTQDDPYLVATADHLDNVRDNLDAHFLQTADIDLGVPPWNVDPGWTAIGDSDDPFTGSFDGNGYVIHNLTMRRLPSDRTREGLFGQVEGATLRNIGLSNVDIEVSFGAGEKHVGALVGYAYKSFIADVFNDN